MTREEKISILYERHSVRKFTSQTIPQEDLTAILAAAHQAPSGKNRQNWHYVIVRNKETIETIARTIREKIAAVSARLLPEDGEAYGKSTPYFTTFITGAPVLVLVYTQYYHGIWDMAERAGFPAEEIRTLSRCEPGIQGMAASLENFMLAAAAYGYGTCWMTGAMVAAEEIMDAVGVRKDGYYLAAMTPLGVPAAALPAKKSRKPLDEMVTYID